MKLLDAGALGIICPMVNTRLMQKPSSVPATMCRTVIGPPASVPE